MFLGLSYDQYRSLLSFEVKAIVDYMKEINTIVEKLTEKIELIDNRLTRIEVKIKPLNKSQGGNSLLENLPELLTANFTPGMRFSIEKKEPELQMELKSVLTRGIELKSVKDAEKEELHNLHTAVHDEFKSISFGSRMKEVNNEKIIESESELKKCYKMI
ncbi:MAG: hypothetical protein ACW964_15810 [Candidatus Hodarchaeales archaeon]|jgi:hypothetical protein